jgi:hypothetical protein
MEEEGREKFSGIGIAQTLVKSALGCAGKSLCSAQKKSGLSFSI